MVRRIGGALGDDYGIGVDLIHVGEGRSFKKTLLLARLLASPCGGEAESGWNLLISLVPEQV